MQLLDLRGTPCPLNYAKTKIHLETLAEEKSLLVRLDRGEALANVSSSLSQEGYVLVAVREFSDFAEIEVKRS